MWSRWVILNGINKWIISKKGYKYTELNAGKMPKTIAERSISGINVKAKEMNKNKYESTISMKKK